MRKNLDIFKSLFLSQYKVLLMRQIMNSQIVLLLLCCLGSGFTASAEMQSISLKTAIDKHYVVLKSAVAGSTESGNKGIELSLVNITCDDIYIDIDPALTFRSKAPGAPTFVLAGNQTIKLPPDKTGKVTLAAYVTDNDSREPMPGEKYRMGKRDERLVALLGYIKEKHISASQAQKAVLAVTDGAALATVYDAHRPKTSKKLQNFLASTINASSGEQSSRKYAAYKPQPVVDSKMFINLDLNLRSSRNLYIHINDAEGFAYSITRQKEYIDGNSHSVDLEIDTSKMPHGTYYVSIRDDDNKTWSQKMIKV